MSQIAELKLGDAETAERPSRQRKAGALVAQSATPAPVAAEPTEQAGSVALMRLIERAATDATFDVAKLEKLLAVKEQWEANEARKAFVAALTAFKADPPSIIKNKSAGFGEGNKRVEYDFATLDQVVGAIASGLSKHGLSHSWETKQHDGGLIEVTCILRHELGHSERTSLKASPDQSGSKNNIQAIGSTITYLERYTLLAATGLAAKEQDDDANIVAGEGISAEQKAELIDLMREVDADTGKFLKFLKVETLDGLPAFRFVEAKRALEAKRKKAASAPNSDATQGTKTHSKSLLD